MEKIKLLNISKEEHRSEYAFIKSKKSFKIITDFLIKLGFDKEEIIHYFEDNENYLENYHKGISGFYNENYSVDIIIFEKEIVLIFNSKEDKQQEISEVIGDFILDEDENMCLQIYKK